MLSVVKLQSLKTTIIRLLNDTAAALAAICYMTQYRVLCILSLSLSLSAFCILHCVSFCRYGRPLLLTLFIDLIQNKLKKNLGSTTFHFIICIFKSCAFVLDNKDYLLTHIHNSALHTCRIRCLTVKRFRWACLTISDMKNGALWIPQL